MPRGGFIVLKAPDYFFLSKHKVSAAITFVTFCRYFRPAFVLAELQT